MCVWFRFDYRVRHRYERGGARPLHVDAPRLSRYVRDVLCSTLLQAASFSDRCTNLRRDATAYGPKYLQLAAELVQTVFAKHSPAQLSLAQECTKQEDARSASRKIAPMPRRSYPSATPTKSISACQPTRPGTSPMSYASALRDSPPKGAETIPPLHNRNAAPSPAPGQFAGGPDWPAHYRVRPPAPLAHARAASTVPCHSPVASAYHRGLTPQEQFLSAMQAGRVQQSVEARIAILQQRQAGEQHPQMHQNQHHAQVHAHAHAHAFQRAPAPYSAGGVRYVCLIFLCLKRPRCSLIMWVVVPAWTAA